MLLSVTPGEEPKATREGGPGAVGSAPVGPWIPFPSLRSAGDDGVLQPEASR